MLAPCEFANFSDGFQIRADSLIQSSFLRTCDDSVVCVIFEVTKKYISLIEFSKVAF